MIQGGPPHPLMTLFEGEGVLTPPQKGNLMFVLWGFYMIEREHMAMIDHPLPADDPT